MRFFILIVFFSFSLFANELDDINSIIKESKVEFKLAKESKDIKKLTQIAKNLYENHKKIKKLKKKIETKDGITLKCNDIPCEKPKLQAGDKLTIVFNLAFDESEEYEKSILIWQLQLKDKLIKNETKEIYEKGGTKEFKVEIKINESFAKGKYRIAMHHKKYSGTTKGENYISIEQPLEVKPIVVSTNKEATKSDKVFRSYDNLYILSGFELSNPKNKINIDVKLTDSTKNEVLLEGSFKRPKEGNTESKQPLRFKIPASKLYDNQKIDFKMNLYANGINPITKNISIAINKFTLLTIPKTLTSGENIKYKVNVPKSFKQPLTVDINSQGGILLSHKSKLSGKISAINKKNEDASVYIKITDVDGKTIVTKTNIKLLTKKENLDTNTDNKTISIFDKNNEFEYVITYCCKGKTIGHNKFSTIKKNKSVNAIARNKFINFLNHHLVNKVMIYDHSYKVYGAKVQLHAKLLYENGMLKEEIIYENTEGYNNSRDWCKNKKEEETKVYSNYYVIKDYSCNPKKRRYYIRSVKEQIGNKNWEYKVINYKYNGEIKSKYDYTK